MTTHTFNLHAMTTSLNNANCTVDKESFPNSSVVSTSSCGSTLRATRPQFGPSTSEMKALTAINSTASLIGFVGNLLVCIVVMKFRFLGRPKAELFIASLAVADLLVCVLAQPMYVLFLHGLLPSHLNMIRQAITWISTLVSVSHLFSISIERFLSLFFLHRYSFFIPDRIIWSSIVFTWLIAIGFGAPAATFRKARHVAQYFVIAILLIIPILYAGTFYIVRLQHQRIKKLRLPAKKLSPSQKRFPRERKIVYMIAVVVGAFYLCIAPLIILPFFFTVGASPAVVLKAKRAFPWVNTVAFCNSCLNPYVYYWRSCRFRLALERILQKIFEKK